MKGRRKVVTVIGETEIGKTSFVVSMLEKYRHGMVTIFDYQFERLLRRYPEINFANMAAQRKGKYRVSSSDWKQFVDVANKLYNKTSTNKGLIYFDDATPYIPKQDYEPLLTLLTGVRHKRLDVMFSFHQLWTTPLQIVRNTQEIILFKTGESEDMGDLARFRHGDRIKEAFIRVKNHPDKHHFERIKLHGI